LGQSALADPLAMETVNIHHLHVLYYQNIKETPQCVTPPIQQWTTRGNGLGVHWRPWLYSTSKDLCSC